MARTKERARRVARTIETSTSSDVVPEPPPPPISEPSSGETSASKKVNEPKKHQTGWSIFL